MRSGGKRQQGGVPQEGACRTLCACSAQYPVADPFARACPWTRRSPPVDMDELIEVLITPHVRYRLPRPTPLPQVIDALVELWENDGLYD